MRLAQLVSLGFTDAELNARYLAESNGNVAAASAALQRHYLEVQFVCVCVGRWCIWSVFAQDGSFIVRKRCVCVRTEIERETG